MQGRQEAISLADGLHGPGTSSHCLLLHGALLSQYLPPMDTARPDQLLLATQALPWLGRDRG